MRNRMTVGEMFELLEIEMPESFVESKDRFISKFYLPRLVITSKQRIQRKFNRSAFFITFDTDDPRYEAALTQALTAARSGAILIVADHQILDEEGNEIPTLVLDDVRGALIKICAFLRSFNDVVTVAVTGTAGKTSTKNYLGEIFETARNVEWFAGNNNTFAWSLENIQRIRPETDVLLQECGALYEPDVDLMGKMLRPNISVITNISEQHLNGYRDSYERYISDKLSLADNLDDGGIAVLNYDDEILRNYQTDKRCVYFSLEDKNADYYGHNIRYSADNKLLCDIDHRGTTTTVETSLVGRHNAYNMLAAFAVAEIVGVDAKSIVRGMKNYETSGIRQNLLHVGEHQIFADCYNFSDESLIGGLKTVEEFECAGRKIAAIGKKRKGEEFTEEQAESVVRQIENLNIDLYIFVDETLHVFYQIAKRRGLDALFVENLDELELLLRSELKKEDLLYLKATNKYPIGVVVDRIFGTDLYINEVNSKSLFAKWGQNDLFKYRMMNGEVVINSYIGQEDAVHIPDEIEGFPVTHINYGAFMHKGIERLIIGRNLVGIGRYAFRGSKLHSLEIPPNVKMISDNAFLNCRWLKKIDFAEGLIHISDGAFRGCANLNYLRLPLSLQYLHRYAFNKTPFSRQAKAFSQGELELPAEFEKIEVPAMQIKSRQRVSFNVQTVSRETGWTLETAQGEMERIREKFNVPFRLYSLYSLYNLSDEEIQNNLDDFIEKFAKTDKAIRTVSHRTGWSYDDAKNRVAFVTGKHKISSDQYLSLRMYDKTESEIRRILRQNAFIQIVVQQTEWSYTRARREMDRLRQTFDKYGVSLGYREYVRYRVYDLDSYQKLKLLLTLRGKVREQIASVRAATGWSKQKAITEMTRARKEYGFSFFRYSASRLYTLNEVELEREAILRGKLFTEQIDAIVAASGWMRREVLQHVKRVTAFYVLPTDYYLLYRMWELSDEEIASYAFHCHSIQLSEKYNSKKATEVMFDKARFHKLYRKYLNRKHWINKDTSYDKFLKFVDGLDYIFCKPTDSSQGRGTEKLKVSDFELRDLYDYLIGREKLLVEEVVHQHKAIDAFTPGCVNTIRVITIDQGDNVEIIAVSIRFGNKDVVDNFSQDGMVCAVDINDGRIVTDAIDRMGVTYTHHPVTGLQFKDFVIPHWNQVIAMSKEAMKVQKGINYIGWDVAVCEDRAVFIEGNSQPDLVLVQAPYSKEKLGQKYKFEKYL